MVEYLSRLNFVGLMAFVVLCGGLIIGLAAVVGGLLTDLRKTEIAAGLKHDMLERGMSSEEISTVLDAGTSRARRAAEESRVECCG